ncbi:RAB6-interacting golgin-like isoform X2 [Cimex lectularius]|uniref:RAB6-interacting golgin n=1 Tax=Cimex lectularius TaxID=79782 RepID=A0A8I6SMU1_CIMLE|nr:RAB6-interacting golgin-like isoform X2 [Cimex lectularius]
MMQRSFTSRKNDTRSSTLMKAELKELDCSLSSDVSNIRDEIEKASLRFTEAQKRFTLAEKEFNTALAELVKEKEKKTVLADHLKDLIERNEMKKAQKLSELMGKFEISSRPTGFSLPKEDENGSKSNSD